MLHKINETALQGYEESELVEDRSLRVQLTDEEKIKYSWRMARLLSEIDDSENELKELKSDYKAKTEAKENNVRSLRSALLSGYEVRSVRCKWFYNFGLGEKALVRTDTMEVVEVEPISEAERQERLDFESEDRTEGGKDGDS